MCARPVISQPTVRPNRGAAGDGAFDESYRRLIVPLLRRRRSRHQPERRQRRTGDARGPARAAAIVASLLAAACTDLLVPTDILLRTEDLLVLPFQQAAPQPGAEEFWVANNRTTLHRMLHPGTSTVFLELRVPSGALATHDGAPLGTADSIRLTLSPVPGRYGFTLSPGTLGFSPQNVPTVTFSFGRYADASVADGSARYESRVQYVQALNVWLEATIDRWRVAEASGPGGVDAVRSAVPSPGQYVLAARR